MAALEKFFHLEPEAMPVLIKAALAHVQFETIHPFLDGNGRVGRLLITFLLCAAGTLREPMLYLSLYFRMHRQTYYDLLQLVRTTGDWEEWLRFFLRGVAETADQASKTARDLLALAAADQQKIEKLGKGAGSAFRVHQYLQKRPVTNISAASAAVRLSVPAVTTAIKNLEKIGILREVTGQKRFRFFAYQKYLDALNEGTQG